MHIFFPQEYLNLLLLILSIYLIFANFMSAPDTMNDLYCLSFFSAIKMKGIECQSI